MIGTPGFHQCTDQPDPRGVPCVRCGPSDGSRAGSRLLGRVGAPVGGDDRAATGGVLFAVAADALIAAVVDTVAAVARFAAAVAADQVSTIRILPRYVIFGPLVAAAPARSARDVLVQRALGNANFDQIRTIGTSLMLAIHMRIRPYFVELTVSLPSLQYHCPAWSSTTRRQNTPRCGCRGRPAPRPAVVPTPVPLEPRNALDGLPALQDLARLRHRLSVV